MLVETQYFPSITFWAQALKKGTVKLEKYENYQKRSYRNKCFILAANGILPLTVLLKSGKNNKKPITEVEISYDDNWQKKHLTSISSAYTSSPYYEFYIDEIKELIEHKHSFLYELNYTILQWFCNTLNIKLSESQEYFKVVENDMRGQFIPSSMKKDYPSYMQVFTDKMDFQSDLSILDLLFCKGPEMSSYLKRL